MKKLFICEKPYPLYRTLIRAIKSEDTLDIVISNHVDGMENIIEPIKESKLFHQVFFYDDKNYLKFYQYGTAREYSKFPKGIFISIRKLMKYIELQKKAKNICLPEGLEIDSYDEIYVNDASSSIMLYLFHQKKEVIWVEHARNIYQIKIDLPFRVGFQIMKYLEKLHILYALHGVSKYVKAIEVTENKNLISLIKKKEIRELDILKVLEKRTEEEKDVIFQIYCKAYQVEIPENKKVGMLLTTNLYEDNLVKTKEEQRQVFQEIIEQEMKELDYVIVKPHPRDTMNYEGISKRAVVVPGVFSAEIFNLSKKLYFEKVFAIRSTSIHAFSKAHMKKELGETYIRKLLYS